MHGPYGSSGSAAGSVFLGLLLLTSVLVIPGSVSTLGLPGHPTINAVHSPTPNQTSTGTHLPGGLGLLVGSVANHVPTGPHSGGPSATIQQTWKAANISLGPPGATPVDTLYVNQTGELYSTVYPTYVVITSPASGSTVARLNLGQGVSTLAYDNLTKEVLVESATTDAILAIDIFTHQLVQSIRLPGPPGAMSYDATNSELVVMIQTTTSHGNGTYTEGGTILVLNGTTSSYPVVTSIPNATWVGLYGGVGEFIGSMMIDTDRQVVYVTGPEGFSGGSGVQWLDLATPSVNGTIWGVGGGALAFDPATDAIYVVGGLGDFQSGNPPNEISVISGITHNVTAVLAPDSEAPILAMISDPTTGRLYATSANGELYAFTTVNNSVVARIALATTCGSAIAIDDTSDTLYVGDACGNELQVVSPGAGDASQIVIGGGGPSGIAYDPRTEDLVIANALENDVTVLSTANQRTMVTIGGIPEATAVVYDPQTSEIFVVGQGGVVVIVSDQSWTVIDELGLPALAPFPAPYQTVAAAYDPLTGQVYVATFNGSTDSSSIYVISGSTHDIVATITSEILGLGPVDALTFDPADGSIWLGIGSGYVGRVNSTDFNITNVEVVQHSGSTVPIESLVYDGGTGRMYAGGQAYPNGSGAIQGVIVGLNSSTGGAISSTPVGYYPFALVWSAQTREILSANAYTDNVSIVDDTTNLVAQTLSVGVGPDALTPDELTGSVYVANYWSNNLSVLIPPPSYAVTFTERGMPPSAGGGVAFSGGSTTPFGADGTLTFDGLTNNTYPYTIRPATGYYELVSSNPGSPITVSGSNVTVSVLFEAIYTLTFTEVGMPRAVGGGVEFDGSLLTPFVRDVDGVSTVTISDLTNGSYPYEVQAAPGYQAVEFVGGTWAGGWFLGPTFNGSVGIDGLDAVVGVTFEAIYPVTFAQVGIPSGSLWTVTVTQTFSRTPTPESWSANSTGPIALLQLPNGTYSYTITADGYPTTYGSFTVDGQALPVPVAVTSSPAGVAGWVYALIGVVIAGMVVGVVIGLMRHRRPPATAASSPPPLSRS